MGTPQSAILKPVPTTARNLSFVLRFGEAPQKALLRVLSALDPSTSLYGLGLPLTLALGVEIPGFRSFPAITARNVAFPSTQASLWIQLRGGDRGQLQLEAQNLEKLAHPSFLLSENLETFVYREGRDLSGYEDGTENPTGDKAAQAAIVSSLDHLDGSSFVAVQRWVHDLEYFNSFPQEQRDHIVGRRISDNAELDDAPESAHVKRTAQESFEPAAFMLRRSMPWIEGASSGLLFIAFGESLDRFERVLRRMAGLDDGIIDALLRFSRPVTGGYYWCPPAKDFREFL